MSFNLSYLKTSLLVAVPYIPVTLALAFLPMILGLLIGFLVATVRVYKIPVLSQIFALFVIVYSGIPDMVSLLLFNLIYITCFKPVAYGGIAVVLLTFTLDRIVYQSETIRSAYLSVPKAQYEAAYSVGLNESQTLRRIIIPQIIPVALPPLTSHIVGAIKNTSIVMVVGVYDVMNAALKPCMDTYSFIEGYVAAAIIFWIVNAFIEMILSWSEKKFVYIKRDSKKQKSGGSYDKA